MSNEVIDRVTALVQGFDAHVQAAAPDAWGNAAPCEGWTARDVVVHVANNIGRLGAGLQGQEGKEVAADDDIVATWNSARDTFMTGIQTGDLSTNLPGPFGPMPAEQLIGRLIATDVLVHTWDLARGRRRRVAARGRHRRRLLRAQADGRDDPPARCVRPEDRSARRRLAADRVPQLPRPPGLIPPVPPDPHATDRRHEGVGPPVYGSG